MQRELAQLVGELMADEKLLKVGRGVFLFCLLCPANALLLKHTLAS